MKKIKMGVLNHYGEEVQPYVKEKPIPYNQELYGADYDNLSVTPSFAQLNRSVTGTSTYTATENFILTGIVFLTTSAGGSVSADVRLNGTIIKYQVVNSAGQTTEIFIPVPNWNILQGDIFSLVTGMGGGGGQSYVSFIGYRN